MEVLNPATGETIAEVPRASAEDVDRAVQAAKKALPEWLETTPGERAELLLKLAAAIDEHADELAELESRNVGKPLSYARDEMPVCADNIRFFAGAARVLEGRSAGEYMRGYTSWLRREPIGIVGGIAPWNYPLMMAVWKLAPAPAASRVVAGPRIYAEPLEERVPAVESLHVGDPAEGDEIERGPVISKAQQERVLGFLERAKGGGQVLTGGDTNGSRGFFVKPTV